MRHFARSLRKTVIGLLRVPSMTAPSGRLVHSCDAAMGRASKLLIVLPYFNGDLQRAEQLAELVADLEPTGNDLADIMLFRRFDANAFSPQVVTKLRTKFGNVIECQCRRSNATGYPSGPNEMWYDLITKMSESPMPGPYYAFLWMEADMVPLRPTWIKEIVEEWKKASTAGKLVVGHFQYNARRPHVNGGAIYAADLGARIGGGILNRGHLTNAWDVEKARFIMPVAQDTSLIYLGGPIDAGKLFNKHAHDIVPAIYHGVKDDSAVRAVRSKWLSESPES